MFTNICMTNIALQVHSNTPLNLIIIVIWIVIGIEYYVKRLNTFCTKTTQNNRNIGRQY
jgi:hypothetical protein